MRSSYNYISRCEVSERLFDSSVDLQAQIAASSLSDSVDRHKALLEDHLREAVSTLVSKLTMEVELDLVADHPAGHRKDASLLHLGFDLLDVARPARSDGHADPACLRQLHPERLELFAIAIASWRELQARRGCRRTHASEADAGERVASVWLSGRGAATQD